MFLYTFFCRILLVGSSLSFLHKFAKVQKLSSREFPFDPEHNFLISLSCCSTERLMETNSPEEWICNAKLILSQPDVTLGLLGSSLNALSWS